MLSEKDFDLITRASGQFPQLDNVALASVREHTFGEIDAAENKILISILLAFVCTGFLVTVGMTDMGKGIILIVEAVTLVLSFVGATISGAAGWVRYGVRKTLVAKRLKLENEMRRRNLPVTAAEMQKQTVVAQ